MLLGDVLLPRDDTGTAFLILLMTLHLLCQSNQERRRLLYIPFTFARLVPLSAVDWHGKRGDAVAGALQRNISSKHESETAEDWALVKSFHRPEQLPTQMLMVAVITVCFNTL